MSFVGIINNSASQLLVPESTFEPSDLLYERISSPKISKSIPQKPMSKFLCKAIPFGSSRVRALAPTADLCPLRWVSSGSNEQSFTVSYLIKSLGFSSQAALLASKHVSFESPENPDKVTNLFKKYGFTQTQISSLVRIRPELLVSNSEKTILPKLEFFEAKGFSWPDLAKSISIFTTILHGSLDKQIIPTYEFYKNFFHSDEKVIMAINRCPILLAQNVEKHVKTNIAILREHGVPDSNIATILQYKPMAFTVSSGRLRKIVEQVLEMGFDASRVTFVLAVSAIRSMSKSTWERKVNAYKKWGWSDEEVFKAFEMCPSCMIASEYKIMAGMDFFVNEMGLTPCRIAKRPLLLRLSLKKRLIPRYFVYRALLSKGLVKEEVSLCMLFETSEKKFLYKFISCHKEDAVELLKLYKEKRDLSSGLDVDKAMQEFKEKTD